MTQRAALRSPDWVLLRRFGLVRAVGGTAYIVAVMVMFVLLGRQVWPLAVGVPVLAVVTTGYFARSMAYPRTAVVVSLVADALVLGGAIAYLGGTGSGLILLYSIVVVSAGILLGPPAAGGFTALTVVLALLQLAVEAGGFIPIVGFNPDLDERLPIFLVSLGGLASVGYLSGTYASRLHELVAEAGVAAEALRVRGRRRRNLVHQATADVRASLRAVEAVADLLDEPAEHVGEAERRRLSGTLRIRVAELEAEIAQLADLGSLDEAGEERPEPVLLRRAVEDCVIGLGERLEPYPVEVDVPPLKVVGSRRATRRVVFNLLENIVEHTPPGTKIHVTALTTAGTGVLVVTDDGPGIPPEIAARMFDPPGPGGEGGRSAPAGGRGSGGEGGRSAPAGGRGSGGEGGRSAPAGGRGSGGAAVRVGLPLVRQLCDTMGAQIRYEPGPRGGARFFVGFRLAPSAAPSVDDEPLR